MNLCLCLVLCISYLLYVMLIGACLFSGFVALIIGYSVLNSEQKKVNCAIFEGQFVVVMIVMVVGSLTMFSLLLMTVCMVMVW